MDPDNPVVKLCVEGMTAESQGQFEVACALFRQAWEACTSDFEACVAAHYMARHQESPEQAWLWNRRALEHAAGAGEDEVRGCYPSLYLNAGYSCETLGRAEEANRYYTMAADRLNDLPPGRYRDMVEDAISRARERVRAMGGEGES